MENYYEYKYNLGDMGWAHNIPRPKQQISKSKAKVIQNIKKYIDKLEDDVVLGNGEYIKKEKLVAEIRKIIGD